VRTQLATFHVGDGLFAIDVADVAEILRAQTMTRVPLAPPEIAGLLNLRGQIVPAVDLARCLGHEGRGVELSHHLIIRSANELVSLLVDEVGDVVEADGDELEEPPENLRASVRALVSGLLPLPEQAALVLVPAHVVAASVRSLPSQAQLHGGGALDTDTAPERSSR